MESIVAISTVLLWTNFTWFNQPTVWSVNETKLYVHTDSDTDFWSKTHYGFERDTGHFYYRSLAGDRSFNATVNIRGQYHTLYDQGGLMLRIDKNNWIKCGIEYVEGQHYASAVVTVNGWSDWSVVAINPVDILKLRVRREKEAVHIYFAEGEQGDFKMLRLAYLPVIGRSQAMMVGIMCASPTTNATGFNITFDSLSIVEEPDKVQRFAIVSSITLAIIYVGSAIAKLVVYSKCSDEECPIETKLNTYLLYGGIVDIAWIGLSIIAPCCGFSPTTYLVTRKTKLNGTTIKKKVTEEEHGGYGTYLVLAALGCLLASFIFACLGNVWILNKYQHVEFYNATSSEYCYPPLFKGAFSMVIITDVWYAFLTFMIIILCYFK
ncbi:unnamed protein product [Adineta steineri]|uniref:Uncharacterized protein n=1 Tax=Adineta steineri TaxID=433720 RepID=A0A819FW28_9BILA|nr:unnamed protein product [Adineta steineri]CAF3875461.1 unnamed protein product [Adineta steineri]